MDEYENRRHELLRADLRRARTWFDGLTSVQRAQVSSTLGVAPVWMVDSLHAAGLQCIPIEEPTSPAKRHLLPMAVLTLLSELRASRGDGLPTA